VQAKKIENSENCCAEECLLSSARHMSLLPPLLAADARRLFVKGAGG
jgi:hypothetical protein